MPKHLWLYDEGTAPTLRCDEVAQFLVELAPRLEAACRGDFITHWLADSGQSAAGLAAKIARAKISDFTSPPQPRDPLPGEIEYERRRLENQNRGPFGIPYDGFELQALLAELMRGREAEAIHVVFTNRLLATWQAHDRRFHLRTIICGAPCVISTSGLIEAPAKPREFYAARRALGLENLASGVAYEALKQQFAGRFLDHDDERLTEVAKGYALQAVAYHVTGEPFCDNARCRLYNAHWQEEMLAAQLGGEVCGRHRTALKETG
jgi:hypothetical protein